MDVKPEVLDAAQKSIQNNLNRVGRKLYKDDSQKIQSFVKEASERIKVKTQHIYLSYAFIITKVEREEIDRLSV